LIKKVAILQSNYIPWKGYFDIINLVDEFILFDDALYTKRDWRNRNLIKTSKGAEWLTIPVDVKGKFLQPIKDVKVADKSWAKAHWASIVHNYSRASFFKDYKDYFSEIYLSIELDYLTDINIRLITSILKILKCETVISSSTDYQFNKDEKNLQLVNICKKAKATHYLSGPSARDYIDIEIFEQNGITVEFMDYSGYPAYSQLYPPFTHEVSILDLIFNVGFGATEFMKSFKDHGFKK
jgi:hypothetical protein